MMQEHDFGHRRAASFRHRVFWALFRERHPQEEALRVRSAPWFWQRLVPDLGMVVTMYVAPERSLVGVFYGKNARIGAADARWKPFQLELEAALGGLPDDQRWAPGALSTVWRGNIFAEDNWPAMSDWMVEQADQYQKAARDVLGRLE